MSFRAFRGGVPNKILMAGLTRGMGHGATQSRRQGVCGDRTPHTKLQAPKLKYETLQVRDLDNF